MFYNKDSLTHIGKLEKVQIGTEDFQVTHIGLRLSQEEEANIIEVLRDNSDLFTWKPSYMPGVDPNVVCHHLSLDPSSKAVMHRKQKNREEKRKVITEEVDKLLKAKFIWEIKYPTWLSNVFMVKKKSKKWRM